MNIRILVFEGADEIDFIAPLEIFRRAAKYASGIHVRLVTLEARESVTAAYGLRVVPDGVLEDAVSLLIVPGGGWAARAPLGIRSEIEKGDLVNRIAALHSHGTIVVGVCTGAMALAAAGLLKGRRAVTHRAALPDLQAVAGEVVFSRVVDDGSVVTCGGVTSSIDLALHLVERFWGHGIAERVASEMEYAR
jgi:transcriptional regulator GlxA family with amidase domain